MQRILAPWHSLPPYRRTLYAGLALGATVTLIMLLFLQNLSIFSRAELTSYDLHFKVRGQIPRPANIVVVGLDQTSITAFGTPYPIPRCFVGHLVDVLHKDGARAIGLDFSYFNPSVYQGNKKYFGGNDDRCFTGALKRAGNVVLNEELDNQLLSNDVGASFSIAVPIDSLLNAVGENHLGVDNVPPDSDGAIRQAWLLQAGPGKKEYPAFPAVLASVALHKPLAEVLHGLPAHMQINYVGAQDPGIAAPQTWSNTTYEFQAVEANEDSSRLFRNAIVLVVPSAIVTGDIHQTPFGTMYGGYIQANALATILSRNPILPAGGTANSLIILIIGFLTTVVATRFGIWRSSLAVLGVAALYTLLTFVLFNEARIWANLVAPVATVVLVYAAILALRFATEERQRRKTHKIFNQYLRPEVVEILVQSPDPNKALAGNKKDLSVLFVDIRGFTSMSEKLQPEQVIGLLDIYLEELTDAVQIFGGTVNKYVGDEIVAMWNTPIDQPEHPMLAVKSALEMVNRIDKINSQLAAKELPLIKYGIGVNTGDTVVGQMGSSFRKQFDVIGDAVNTGARLCSAAGGGEIIMGQTTWERIGDQLVLEETEPLRLKGKSQPLRTFRVIGLLDAASPTPTEVPAPALA